VSVRIKSPLPRGDRNGLVWVTDEVYDKRDPVMAVVELVPDQIIDRVQSEDDPKGLVLMVAGIEALTGMDAEAAKALLDTAYSRRTGKESLPFGTVLDVNPDELDEPPMGEWMGEDDGGDNG
jgi:hypothetical protein